MENKQLKILLKNYSRRLEDAVAKIEEDNPELMEEYKTPFGKHKRIKALHPIREFLSDLKNDIKNLDE